MAEEPRPSVRLNELEDVLGGKYRIIKRIGVGGFGEVYLGEHKQLHRKVAIKILLGSISNQPELVERFQREARSAATLSHPNIIDIYDVGEGAGIYYFVMKFIDGETLSEKMHRERKMAPAEAIQIAAQVADALAYAHDNDVVHRDIKPANVMLDEYGKPLLMDFGVARVQFEGNLTKTGTLLGTPHYLPPEQPLGKPVDGRSDIYSLGIMLYEMLSGQPPFHDENSISLIFKHINDPPPPLNSLVPDLDPELCVIIHKMIEKNPENRQQHASDVVAALHEMGEIYPTTPITLGRRSTPGGVRNTERLLLLAKEHLQQDKIDKAVEIYHTISKRDPNNETARKEVEELIPKVIEKVNEQITGKHFSSARELLSQANVFAPDSVELQDILTNLNQAEEEYAESEVQAHCEAAESALKENKASAALQHLTRASTISSSNEQVQELLKETEQRITTELRMHCEGLNFAEAEKILEMGKESFPEYAKEKMLIIQHHRTLFEKLEKAREKVSREEWEEAEHYLVEFLDAPDEYEFEVFHSLREEAAKTLEEVRGKIPESKDIRTADARPPEERKARKTPETVAQKSSTGFLSQQLDRTNWRRVLIYCVCGVLLTGAFLGVLAFMNGDSETSTTTGQTISLLRRLAKTQEEPKPVSGKLSITSEPAGAKVFFGEEEKGETPLELSDMALGKYELTVKLKGYQDFAQEIELTEENPNATVPITLEEIVQLYGTLVIESTPPGADVVLNNRVIGKTPKTLESTNVGRYSIGLRLQGYEDYKEVVRVAEAKTTNIRAELKAIPKQQTAEAQEPEKPAVTAGMLVPLDSSVDPPKTKEKSYPKYPDAARSQKLEGTVKLNVLVSENGDVLDIKVIESAHPLLDAAAVEAVRQWKYDPATKEGVRVKVWLPTSITFVKR